MSLRAVVESKRFEYFIVAIIAANAVTLGLETVSSLSPSTHQVLVYADRLFLAIFTVELALKISVYRRRFFADPWRIFDFIIVGISLLPASGPFSVLRSLRALRALRMVSVVPSLRKVVNGLLRAIPGLGAVAAIMCIIFYAASVMATKLFGSEFPLWFGSIGESAYSLFQIMTLESWSMGIVRPVMEKYPYAWSFFLPFILVATFTMLNLFIAVIVNAMHSETDEAAEKRAVEGQDERSQMLHELKALRQQVERVAQRLEQNR